MNPEITKALYRKFLNKMFGEIFVFKLKKSALLPSEIKMKKKHAHLPERGWPIIHSVGYLEHQ